MRAAIEEGLASVIDTFESGADARSVPLPETLVARGREAIARGMDFGLLVVGALVAIELVGCESVAPRFDLTEVAAEEQPLIGRDPLWLLGSRPFSGRRV
ncbi:MAG: hypothetical protein ACYCUM_14705 [Solirubrobacteraceae bacterium]